MPNVSPKKLKLLYLWRILFEKTDQQHALSLPRLLEELENYGLTAERKSIYDDIATLQAFGVKIEKRKTRTFEYFLASRDMDLPEIKALAEAVLCNEKLSQKKAGELIEKLSAMCSTYQAEELPKVSLMHKQRREAEKLPRQIETIRNAMSVDRQISFYPVEWQLTDEGKLERRPRKTTPVVVSPWKLEEKDTGWQLMAYDSDAGRIRPYLIDEMDGLEVLPQNRKGAKSAAAVLSVSERLEKLTFEFPPEMLSQVVAKFGKEIEVEEGNKGKLRAVVRAGIDEALFAWLFSRGMEIKLVAPKKLAEQFREKAKATAKWYK